MSIGRAHSLDDVDMSSFEWLAESMRVPKSHAMARLSKLASSVEAAVEQALSDVEAGGVPIVLSIDFPRLIPQIGNADAEPAYGPCGSYEEAAGYAEYGTLSLMIA